MLKMQLSSVRYLATIAKNSTPKLTDVLIVGGGPAGLTLAAAIKNSPTLAGLSTTLVDAGDLKKVGEFHDQPPEHFTNRVVSITPKSLHFIAERAGAGDFLLRDRIQPYDGLYVTDGVTKSLLDLEKPSMLEMIEILNIQSSLLKKLSQYDEVLDGFKLVEKSKVTKIENTDPKDPTSWPLVTLDNGDVYKTRLLVGADGFQSPVRKFANIETRGWFYGTFGVVATMKLQYDTYKLRGWQRFLPDGPIAHLPLPGENATLVWTTTERISKLLLTLDPKAFASLVNAAFVLDNTNLQYYFDELEAGKISTNELIEDVKFRMDQEFSKLSDETMIDELYPPQVIDIKGDTRARFPLKMTHADNYCSHRVALVGDAAHTTHPLAGQGLNMGQGDVEALVDALEKATQRGQDIGALLSLEPFWAERYATNHVLLNMADKLYKLYHTDSAPVVALRSLGLDLTNNFPPVKNWIVKTLTADTEF